MSRNVCIILVLLLGASLVGDQSEPIEDKKPSAATRAFGKNFERNTMPLAMSLKRGRPSPSSILQDEQVLAALDLKPHQREELAQLPGVAATFQDVMTIAGLENGSKLAGLSEKEMTTAGNVVHDAFLKSQASREDKVKNILTPKQYARMHQIFLQKTLLFGVRAQVGGYLGLDEEELLRLNLALQETDKKLAIEILELKWRRFVQTFDEQIGSGTASREFGEPFYVEATFENHETRSNRRRDRSASLK